MSLTADEKGLLEFLHKYYVQNKKHAVDLGLIPKALGWTTRRRDLVVASLEAKKLARRRMGNGALLTKAGADWLETHIVSPRQQSMNEGARRLYEAYRRWYERDQTITLSVAELNGWDREDLAVAFEDLEQLRVISRSSALAGTLSYEAIEKFKAAPRHPDADKNEPLRALLGSLYSKYEGANGELRIPHRPSDHIGRLGWKPRAYNQAIQGLANNSLVEYDDANGVGYLTQRGVDTWEHPELLHNTLPVSIAEYEPPLPAEPNRVVATEATPTGSAKPHGNANEPMKTRTLSILFMDVSGWSKLGAHEIHQFVTKAMPTLKSALVDEVHVNTWGDAIVATFKSAKSAAESALKIKHAFEHGYPQDGFASGLSSRVSLHVGEVIECYNPITERDDIFGAAVHFAARLEPATTKGYVFCSDDFASKLKEVAGVAPKAWPHKEIEFAKGFGTHRVHVVTGPNERDPGPALASVEPRTVKPKEAAGMTDEDALLIVSQWLDEYVLQSLDSFAPKPVLVNFAELDAELRLPAGTTKRLIKRATTSDPQWILEMGDGVARLGRTPI